MHIRANQLLTVILAAPHICSMCAGLSERALKHRSVQRTCKTCTWCRRLPEIYMTLGRDKQPA